MRPTGLSSRTGRALVVGPGPLARRRRLAWTRRTSALRADRRTRASDEPARRPARRDSATSSDSCAAAVTSTASRDRVAARSSRPVAPPPLRAGDGCGPDRQRRRGPRPSPRAADRLGALGVGLGARRAASGCRLADRAQAQGPRQAACRRRLYRKKSRGQRVVARSDRSKPYRRTLPIHLAPGPHHVYARAYYAPGQEAARRPSCAASPSAPSSSARARPSASAISASVTTSGGRKRSVRGPVALSTSRCSISARRTSAGASSRARRRPSARRRARR